MKIVTPIQTRFADTDRLGHINNACYLSYCELARMDVFDKLFGRGGINWNERGFILARAETDFIRPLYLDDTVEVETTCSRIGTKSFVLDYEIFAAQDDTRELAARSNSVLVAFDYVKNVSMEIPPDWKNVLKQLLNQE